MTQETTVREHLYVGGRWSAPAESAASTEVVDATEGVVAGRVPAGGPADVDAALRAAREALRVARRIRSGQVDVNGGAFNPIAPFGGVKHSGYGREFGTFGVEEFTELKAVQR